MLVSEGIVEYSGGNFVSSLLKLSQTLASTRNNGSARPKYVVEKATLEQPTSYQPTKSTFFHTSYNSHFVNFFYVSGVNFFVEVHGTCTEKGT